MQTSLVAPATKGVGTYVTVGFMPSKFIRMFDALEEVQDLLPRPIRVQAGGLTDHKFFARCELVFSICATEEADSLMRNSELVVAHCGVGSMKSVLSRQKRAVFFPRTATFGEHVDDHQIELGHVIENEGIGTVVWPNAAHQELRDVVLRALVNSDPQRSLTLEAPRLDEASAWLLVSSVGGHRSEIQNLALGLHILEQLTDEECEETKTGRIRRFPSCGKKAFFFVRLVQAVAVLREYTKRSERKVAVLTTGAGVGAVFVLASRLLGLDSVAIESLTRIDKPSLWFRAASRFASKSYCYSWARWQGDYPKVATLGAAINLAPRPRG